MGHPLRRAHLQVGIRRSPDRDAPRGNGGAIGSDEHAGAAGRGGGRQLVTGAVRFAARRHAESLPHRDARAEPDADAVRTPGPRRPADAEPAAVGSGHADPDVVSEPAVDAHALPDAVAVAVPVPVALTSSLRTRGRLVI